MRSLFRWGCYGILLATLLFVTIPFFAIIWQGVPFLLTWPYPGEVQAAFRLSMWTSLLASTVCVALTVPIIYIMNLAPLWIRKPTHYLFSLPMATPHLVAGIALLIVFGQKGIGAFLLEHFGIDFVYTVQGVWLAMLFVNLPFSIITVDSAYNVVDEKLLFTARTLGLREHEVFLFVLLPMLKRALFGVWIMNWARCIGEFGAIMILVGVTRFKTETLATAIFLNLSTGDFSVATGVAALLLVISMAVMWLSQRIIKDSHATN